MCSCRFSACNKQHWYFVRVQGLSFCGLPGFVWHFLMVKFTLCNFGRNTIVVTLVINVSYLEENIMFICVVIIDAKFVCLVKVVFIKHSTVRLSFSFWFPCYLFVIYMDSWILFYSKTWRYIPIMIYFKSTQILTDSACRSSFKRAPVSFWQISNISCVLPYFLV
jgi:hypothetical protein